MSYYKTSGYLEACGDNSYNIKDYKSALRSYRAAQKAIKPEDSAFNDRFRMLQNKLIKAIAGGGK